MKSETKTVGGRVLPFNDMAPFRGLVRALAALAHDSGPKVLVPGQDGGAMAVNVRVSFQCAKGCFHSWLCIAQQRQQPNGTIIVVPSVMEEIIEPPEEDAEENPNADPDEEEVEVGEN